MVPVTDPLDFDKEQLVIWSERVDEHFQHHDSSETPSRPERLGTSALMVQKQAAGAPEFAPWAEVAMCESGTVDFAPILAETERFRYAFTAPTGENMIKHSAVGAIADEVRQKLFG